MNANPEYLEQLILAIGTASTAIGIAIVGVLNKLRADSAVKAQQNIERIVATNQIRADQGAEALEHLKTMSDQNARSTSQSLANVTNVLAAADVKQQAIYHQGNSAALTQKKILAHALRRISDMTSDPQDVRMAEEADRAVEKHLEMEAKLNTPS